MKKYVTLDDYIKLLIKDEIIDDDVNELEINIDENIVKIKIIEYKVYKSKGITYVYYKPEFDFKETSFDENILNLPLLGIECFFEDNFNNSKYYRKMTIRFSEMGDIIRPSKTMISERIWRGANKHNSNYYYAEGECCIVDGELYKSKIFNYGKFTKTKWIKIDKVKCSLKMTCANLPVSLCSSFLYKKAFFNWELYYNLIKNGNTVISGSKYNNAIDYISRNKKDFNEIYSGNSANEIFNRELERCLNLKKKCINIKSNISKDGSYYIIENSNMINKKAMSKI